MIVDQKYQKDLDALTFVQACSEGNLEIVNTLIAEGINVDTHNYNGLSSLLIACLNKQTEIAHTLIKAGAEIDQTRFGIELRQAIKNGNFDVVQSLLIAETDPNCQDKSGNTPLSIAAQHGHANILRLLHENGAILPSHDRLKLLLNRVIMSGPVEVVDFLIQRQPDVIKDYTFLTELTHVACRLGPSGVVKLLVSLGATVTTRSVLGDTLIHESARNARVETISLLIKEGLDVNAKNFSGETALYLAAQNGSIEAVNLLLHAGADVNTCTNDGTTALMSVSKLDGQQYFRAGMTNDPEFATMVKTPMSLNFWHERHDFVVNALLKAGANVNVMKSDLFMSDCTALSYACINGHLQIVRMLLDAGAEVGKNEQALIHEHPVGFKELAKLLIAAQEVKRLIKHQGL